MLNRWNGSILAPAGWNVSGTLRTRRFYRAASLSNLLYHFQDGCDRSLRLLDLD